MDPSPDEKPKDDYLSTTAILARRAPGFAWLPIVMRKKFSPAIFWRIVCALAGAAAIAVGWWLTTQRAINELEYDTADSKKSITEMRQQMEVLNKIDKQLAVVNSKVDNIAAEVDRQREWRDRIEQVAEEPTPHIKRRSK